MGVMRKTPVAAANKNPSVARLSKPIATLRLFAPRPFARFRGAYWLLIFALAVGLAGLLFPPPHYVLAAVLPLAVFAVAVEAWSVTAGGAIGGDAPAWPRRRRFLKRFVLLALWMGLLVLVIAFVCLFFAPHEDGTTQRLHVAEAIASVEPLKSQIAGRVRQGTPPQSAGLGLAVAPVGRIVAGSVSENGTITIAITDPPALVILKIDSVDTQTRAVKWRCNGSPAKLMFASCRE